MKLICWAGAALAVMLATTTSAADAQASSVKPPSSASVNGAMPEYVEEFFLSDAVRNEDRNELQVTVDGMASKDHQSAADGSSAGLDLEYGITSRVQWALEVPFGFHSTVTSEIPATWSKLSTSILYQVIRSSHPFALTVGAGANLPLNSRGETSFGPVFLLAKTFGDVQIHANVEPELSKDDRSLEYNLAAVKPWPHRFFPTLEFNGRRNSGVNSFYLTPGLYRRLPHRLEMGAGFPVGMGAHSSPIGVVFKMTWEIGGDEDKD